MHEAPAALPIPLSLPDNSTLLSPNNATASSFLTTCTPEHFLVPLFGGSLPDSSNSFTSKNQDAHLFLGGCLVLLVTTWSLFAMEFLSVRRTLRVSGGIQVVMGVYLTLWLYVLMYPYDLLGLWAYSTSDLLQLQHLSIALLLLASGLLELAQAALVLEHSQWSVLWTFCMAYVGLVFFAHEQHSYWATVQHIALGFVMVCGAILQGKVKEGLGKELATEVKGEALRAKTRAAARRNRRGGYRGVGGDSDDDDGAEDEGGVRGQHAASRLIDCNLILAGVFFSVAAGILILFRDHSHGQHTGTSTYCQPAWPLTAGGYVVALVTIALVGVAVCLVSPRCRGCADACCPVDEDKNIWLRALNCLLGNAWTKPRKAKAQASSMDEPMSASSATAQMLRIVQEKEAEEERERERAVRRLQDLQHILKEHGSGTFGTAAFAHRRKAHEEAKEAISVPDTPVPEVVEVEEQEQYPADGRGSTQSTDSSAS